MKAPTPLRGWIKIGENSNVHPHPHPLPPAGEGGGEGSEAAMGNWLVIQTYFDVARAKEQAPKTKRAGVKPFYFPPAYFPQRDAGEKG